MRDVYTYSYYRIGNHRTSAEDITEQTFLQAYRHFERALRESDGRPLRPWLIRIAHNLAANFYRDRSRKPESAIEDAGLISAPHTTEALVEGREELKSILEGVSASCPTTAARRSSCASPSGWTTARSLVPWARPTAPRRCSCIGPSSSSRES